MHRVLRRIAPFLYERNWYNGQLEFSRSRALLFGIVAFCALLVLAYVWAETRPIEYIRSI